jgi:hypothetical protein
LGLNTSDKCSLWFRQVTYSCKTMIQ